MSKHSVQAAKLFKQGYNCAQSVFCAFCDETGLDFDTAVKLSSSFGGGMGRLREVCGAVTGILMVLGLKYGYTGPNDDKLKAEHYELIQSIAKKFKDANGSYICRELLGLSKGPDNPVPEARTETYYETRPCERLVEFAAELADEIISNRTDIGGNKMKIAVASEGRSVTEHFGHCQNFNIFYVENNIITKKESIPNPGHRPGFLPNFLNDMGVNVIISGGMGGGAVEIFNEKNIEVITGARGDAEAAAKSYLEGNLKTTGSVCHEHQHSDEC